MYRNKNGLFRAFYNCCNKVAALQKRRARDREDLYEEEQLFHQDGTLLHTANFTMTWLREKLGERLISRKAVEWGPQSPNLNAPDLFLLGFLRVNIYHGNLRTIATLKAAITQKI